MVNAPDSFRPEMEAMQAWAEVGTAPGKWKKLSYVVVFALALKEVEAAAKTLLPKMEDDGIIWMAYPKGTSKKYKCDFNRDTGWASFGEKGYEPVRAIAIDEDWSALRFRQVENIKTMTRSFAMTEAGKQKVAAAKKKGK